MAENFYTILTNIGLAKIANSQVIGGKVNLVEMAVGDSNGTYYNPTSNATALKKEVWRGTIGSVEIDENNTHWIVIETIIPATAGGFTVREVGLFDDVGDLIAIGKFPETYKPVLDEGSAKDLYVRMIIEVSNAAAVTLKVDPTVIIATRKYVDDKFAQTIGPMNEAMNEIKNGNLTISSLQTDNKTLAGSINEINDYAKLTKEELQLELQTMLQNLGELSSLDTDAKSNLVSSINEVVAEFTLQSENISNLNDGVVALESTVNELQEGSAVIPELETENKTLAGAINEVDGKVTEITEEVATHLADDANPHKTTSEQLVAIDRTNYSFNSPPSAYPPAYSVFAEIRNTQMAEWRQALNLPNLSAQRFIIETLKRGGAGDVFQSHKQIITYLRSPAGEEPTPVAIIYRVGGQGDVWGPPIRIMDELGGRFSGIVSGKPNTSYTVPQFRNSIIVPSKPTADMIADGEYAIVFEE